MGLALVPLLATAAQAATIVSVQTVLGTYKVELYEDLAPNTVARFLSDIESGRYHFSFLHFAANTYFVGGRYVYNSCSQGPEEIDAGAPIAVEETGLANTTGTVAMVRDSSNPSILTGEYLVNLGTNTPASQSTAPVVIGTIIEGLAAADSVADLWKIPMDVSPSVPTVNYNGMLAVQCGLFDRDNLIQSVLAVDSVDSGGGGGPVGNDDPANYYDPATGRVHVKVDAGSEGLLSLAFEIVQTEPQVVIQVIQETVATLSVSVDKIATFTPLTGTLILPELSIDNVVTYKDMFFKLSDTEQLQFTLQSFTQN